MNDDEQYSDPEEQLIPDEAWEDATHHVELTEDTWAEIRRPLTDGHFCDDGCSDQGDCFPLEAVDIAGYILGGLGRLVMATGDVVGRTLCSISGDFYAHGRHRRLRRHHTETRRDFAAYLEKEQDQ